MKRDSRLLRFLLPGLIMLAVACVLSPVLCNGFVLGDDNIVIVQNERIRSFSPENLSWMFTNFRTGKWLPLGWIAYTGIYSVFGLNPVGYHFAQLALHAANSALLYFLILGIFSLALKSLTREMGIAAALGALFYALHPLRVETAAWAA